MSQTSTRCEFRNHGRTIKARCTRSDEGVALVVTVLRSGKDWTEENSGRVVRSTLNRALMVARAEFGLWVDEALKLRRLLND
jgi:hypothetical protein